MTENAAREAVYGAWVSGWTPSPAVPEGAGNESRDPGQGEYAHIEMLHTSGGQHTLGETNERRFRRFGLVFIRIWVLVDKGLQRFDELTRLARNIFEGKTINGVWFTDGLIRESGPTEDGRFLGIVTIDFSYEETK